MNEKVLVTGGAGYIGSHTTLALLEAGHDVVVLDNLINSSVESLHRVTAITGCKPKFIEGDIRDNTLLKKIFEENDFSAVMHFAGLKAVGESVKDPLTYHENNVCGSVELAKAAARAGVFRMVFSSSATVYGNPVIVPIDESAPLGEPTNPYGWSKLIVERILTDLAASNKQWKIALLRYFNPVGAHESGLIGEDPNGVPSNLFPYISQVAAGRLTELKIFGNDYPTRDGTGIRDYIHVMDLADGHLKALKAIEKTPGIQTWNLGTGIGYSVLEIVNAFEKVIEKKIPYRIISRRPGDVAECWASSKKAALEMNWHTKRDLNQMLIDAWNWQSKNPDGYP